MVFVRRIHIFKLPLFVFFLLALPLVADDDWSDLHKDEKKIYGSEKEIKYDVNAFFWERENWDQHYSNEVLWLYKHTDYPKFRSTYVFPFYNGLESKFDNRKKYRFLNFYYKQDKSLEQAVFFPFVFQGGDKAIGESYLGIFPAFYSRTYEGNGFSGSTFLTPFFYRSTDKTKTEKISEEEAFSISPFHLNIYEKKIKSEKETWMFPILPLVYLNWQNTDFHANLFWVFDYSSQNDKLNTLAFFPFLFLDKSERGYLHILPPLYLNFWNDSEGTYYRHILPFYFSFGDKNGNTIFGPLFYHDESKSGNTNWAGLFHWKRDAVGAIPKFWFVPFYFSNEEISVGEKKSSGYRHIFPPFYLSLWDDSDKSFYRHIFPAFFSFGDRDQQTYFGPFYFHKDEEKRSSTLIGNIYWQKEKASGLSAIWIMPVYFSGESVSPGGLSTTGYKWILPLYYSAWDDFSGSKYLHLFPFYFSYSIKNEETFFGPFYYHNRSGKSGSTLIGNVYWSENSGTGESYFQIFPFYFSSKSDLSVTRNILFFANWKSRDPDGLESMQLFPFLFYEKNSYFHVFPFYWSATLSDNSFFSVSPVHYIRRTVKRDTTWVANYYSSEDRPGKEKFLTFFPFYFEWDTPESVGNLTIPLHLKYTDENRDVDLYFPGLSIAKTRGTLGADFSIGKKNSRYYLDFEVSWWYNLFSIATRTTFDIPVPWSREAKAATAASLVASGVAAPGQSKDDSPDAGKNPKLVKNKTVSRETSENFWGWNFLFGIAAFEKADSKRHVRVLPLTWLTWDEKSKDKIGFFFPLINVWYFSGDFEYQVFFPFYAHQREGKSFIRSFLLNMYIKEYDEKKNLTEHSIVWPLINFYDSPEKGGSRFFPLYWYKRTTKENVTDIISVSPLHYYHSEGSGNYSIYKFWSYLFYREYSFSGKDEEKNFRSKTALFPFFYTNFSDSEKYLNFIGLFNLTLGEKETTFTLFPLFQISKTSIKEEERLSHWLLPVYYYKSINGKDFSESKFIAPMIYHSSEKSEDSGNSRSWVFLFYRSYSYEGQDKEKNFQSKVALFPVFYRSSSDNYVHYNFLGIFDYSGGSDENNFWIFPLFRVSSKQSGSASSNTSWLLPLFYTDSYQSYSEGVKTSEKISPLFYYKGRSVIEKGQRTDSASLWIFPMFYYAGTSSPDFTEATHFYLINYYSYSESRKVSQPEEYTIVNPLFYKSQKSVQGKETGSTFFFPIIPFIFYKSQTENNSHFNMLCFFDLQTDKAKQEFSLFAFGLYVHSSPGYSRQNLLYLVDHQYYKKVDKEHLRLFLGTIHFEREKDRQSFYLFYGLLFGYEQLGEGYFDVNFLWLRYLNTRDHLRMNFLPVYYYDRTSKETVHVIPPLLSYSSVTQDEVFQLGLLGLGYYRNYNRKEKEDTKAFLLGSVYYESSEKERGYKSRGSLWGVLWQEQSESETGYSKFSVLKILYSQTTINGETRHRIFGIRL